MTSTSSQSGPTHSMPSHPAFFAASAASAAAASAPSSLPPRHLRCWARLRTAMLPSYRHLRYRLQFHSSPLREAGREPQSQALRPHQAHGRLYGALASNTGRPLELYSLSDPQQPQHGLSLWQGDANDNFALLSVPSALVVGESPEESARIRPEPWELAAFFPASRLGHQDIVRCVEFDQQSLQVTHTHHRRRKREDLFLKSGPLGRGECPRRVWKSVPIVSRGRGRRRPQDTRRKRTTQHWQRSGRSETYGL
ncbi:hypothetical protein V8E36_001369 [Tilletia maclaganii]